jgi:putative glutamine amidotransferase
MAPLIAVSTRSRQPGEVHLWPVTAAAVMQRTYLDAIWRAGGMESMVAPRRTSFDDMRAYLRRVDGLILVGGGDVDPARYGQEAHHSVYGIDEESDSLEAALILAAIELDVPTLAICRGMQVLNVALGGTLDQHITGKAGYADHGDPRVGFALHDVAVEPGTLLSKAVGGASTIESCWSYHHQALDQLGESLAVSARSIDGAIEAVEFSDANDRGWMVAIQWHPERTAHEDSVQQGLFDELVRQAELYRNSNR